MSTRNERSGRRGRRPSTPDVAVPVVRGALALAAHFFPRTTPESRTCVRTTDALFFLSGQTNAWSRWPELPKADKVLIAQLLRWRPVEIANRTTFASLVRELVPDPIADFRVLDDTTVLVEVSGPPRLVVEECVQQLWLQRETRPRRPRPIANNGTYVTLIRGRTTEAVEAIYDLSISPPAEPEPPTDLGHPADADIVDVPVDELHEIASRLDAAFEQTHRTESVARIFGNLRSEPDSQADGRWVLRAGPTRLLNAPTGVGKNILAELTACWCAQRGMVTTLVVPRNAVVVQAAHSIEAALRVLGLDDVVVPLMSPRSMVKEAEAAATGEAAGRGEWAYERMHYGCALPSAATTDAAVDAWDPGAEPCSSLRVTADTRTASDTRHRCPWKPTCGKFRLARSACSASVIVTNHTNFVAGRLQVPLVINGRVEDNPTVEEVLLHRSHVVLVDEIDAFQAGLISSSANGLQLANRRGAPPSPLRQLDREFNDAALGHIDTRIEGQVQAALSQARFLAENYNRHLAADHFRRSRRGAGSGHPMFGRWLLPRRWDAWLAAALFNVPDGAPPGSEYYDMLEAMFPLADTTTVLPAWLEPVARTLALMTSSASGDDLFDDGWIKIHTLLADHPYGTAGRLEDTDVRTQATDRLVRRAHLEPLRKHLFTFVYTAPQLHASGVGVAGDIASALGQYAAWRVAPYGPMGRVLFAFTEQHDPELPRDTSLRVSGFGGDPHTYVTTLGDLTALAHTGRRRIVVGLSATGYFPGAPHHHVHARPSWWVPDDATGGIEVHAAPVTDEEMTFLRVSGTWGAERSDTLVQLGRRLWTTRLEPGLVRLASDPASAHRARLLLATTSYQGAHDLARGLSAAGVPAERIVLAVRPNAADSLTASSGPWTELPADRLEQFGRTVGLAPGSVLVAPLARAERGLNIVDEAGRSLVGSVWLVVRPVPILDEPPELLAHVHARAHDEATPTDDPAAVLDLMRVGAAKHFDELFASLPYFRSMPRETQLAIARETLNGIIQLAGRARRGGDIGVIHLVDYAFHDTTGRSDLPALIRRIRSEWDRNGHLDLMRSLYGRTLEAIFEFADRRQDDE